MSVDFAHRQSAHCESGVVSSLMRFHGLDFDEPMVFGIGSLGIVFLLSPICKSERNSCDCISYLARANFQTFL